MFSAFEELAVSVNLGMFMLAGTLSTQIRPYAQERAGAPLLGGASQEAALLHLNLGQVWQ